MATLKLTPKTQKGRNRIREAGTDMVFILREHKSPQIGPGNWALVRFIDSDPKHDRWIKLSGDIDFILDDIDPA